MGDESPEDQAMLVTEKCCFRDLVDGLSSPCQCGLTMRPWQLESLTQVNTNDMHAHVCGSVPTCTCVDSFINFRKDMCSELFSPVAVVTNKGHGQVRGFSVDIS